MRENPKVKANVERMVDFGSMMTAGMGVSRLRDLGTTGFDAIRASGGFCKSGIDDVVLNLFANRERLELLSTLPIGCFDYGRRYEQVFSSLGGYVENLDRGEWCRVSSQIHNWVVGADERPTNLDTISHLHAAGFATVDDPEVARQIESFGTSIVIEAWGMFETLCEELLDSASAVRPTLTTRSGTVGRSRFASGNNGKRKKKARLRTLTLARDEYNAAFAFDYHDIDKVLDDSGIQFASAVRNVLVHKRGVVDQEYLDQIKGIQTANQNSMFPHAAMRLNVNDELKVTGPVCDYVCDSCFYCSVALLVAVHNWIMCNP